jgi:translation initiation factor 3 subunit E
MSSSLIDHSSQAKLTSTGSWNVAGLLSSKQITSETVELYRKLAHYNFDCGDYQAAREKLTNYISFFASPPALSQEEDEDLVAAGISSTSQNASYNDTKDKETGNSSMYYLKNVDDTLLQALWGRLACEILVTDWEAASVAVDAVKTGMETMVAQNKLSALSALQQRTWLLHWSLFVYWNDSSKGGLEQLVDLFQSERYKQAITTNAPHLLRYLTAAVLLCKRRITKKAAAGANAEARRLMKNLINVMNDCEYSDPIVEFVNCLCVKFDFQVAQAKLSECEQVLSADFFLCHQTKLLMEEARVFVFENFCRIHNKIDLKALGEKLAMDQEEAERWIVDLIRNADLDAKIDSDEGCVVMGATQQSVYEQVVERTRDLNVRSAALSQNVVKLLDDAKKEKAKREKASREED